jgi:polar amino acid transport system substrate-binding protein
MRLASVLPLVLLSVAGAASADTITIRSDSWYPYNGKPGGKPEGYMIEAARAIAKANGHTIDYRLLDWDASIEQVGSGNFDCLVGATRDDAPKLAFPKLSWGKSNNVLFVLAENPWTFKGTASLKGQKLVVISGYAYGDSLDAYIKAAPKDAVVSIENNRNSLTLAIQQMVTRKGTVLVEDSNVAFAKFAQMEMIGRFRVAGEADAPSDVFIACTPNAKGRKYVAMFDAGLAQLRKSGELKKILARHGLQDWAGR